METENTVLVIGSCCPLLGTYSYEMKKDII